MTHINSMSLRGVLGVSLNVGMFLKSYQMYSGCAAKVCIRVCIAIGHGVFYSVHLLLYGGCRKSSEQVVRSNILTVRSEGYRAVHILHISLPHLDFLHLSYCVRCNSGYGFHSTCFM